MEICEYPFLKVEPVRHIYKDRLAQNQIVETALWQRQYDISTRLDNVIENVVVSSYPFAYYDGYTIFISAIGFTPILNFAYGKNCQFMQ